MVHTDRHDPPTAGVVAEGCQDVINPILPTIPGLPTSIPISIPGLPTSLPISLTHTKHTHKRIHIFKKNECKMYIKCLSTRDSKHMQRHLASTTYACESGHYGTCTLHTRCYLSSCASNILLPAPFAFHFLPQYHALFQRRSVGFLFR